MKSFINYFISEEKYEKTMSYINEACWFSNISKNIQFFSYHLVALAHKMPAAFTLLTSLYLLDQDHVKVHASDCPQDGLISPTDTYFTHSKASNSFLWIKVSDDIHLEEKICDFLPASKQSGLYETIACLCPHSGAGRDYYYGYSRIAVYGQQISAEMRDCLIDYLKTKCPKDSDISDYMLYIMVPACIGILIYLGVKCMPNISAFCSYYFNSCFNICRRPRQSQTSSVTALSMVTNHSSGRISEASSRSEQLDDYRELPGSSFA